MSKERPRRTPMGASDEKSSNRLLVGLGIGLVTSVTGLCFAGTLTAINAMNRQSDMAIATARNMVMNESGSNSSVENDGTVVNTEPVVDTVQEEDDWTSDQIKWMQENHITYDSEGNPRNDKGELVDDPTTKKDESNVVKETPDVGDNVEIPEAPDVENPVASPVPSSTPVPTVAPVSDDVDVVVNPNVETPNQGQVTEPALATNAWWLDQNGKLLSGLQLDANGEPYYVVQRGDWLSIIGMRYGFDYNDLAQVSGIQNPDRIFAGNIIHFPKSGPTMTPVTQGNIYTQAPGRG